MTPEEKAELKAEITQELGLSLQEHYVAKADLESSVEEQLGKLISDVFEDPKVVRPMIDNLLGGIFKTLSSLQIDVNTLQLLITLEYRNQGQLMSEEGKRRFNLICTLYDSVAKEAREFMNERLRENTTLSDEEKERVKSLAEFLQ